MPYATQAQIELAAGGNARLVQLSDWDDDGDIDADVIAEAQLRADGWINGYLSGGYLRDQVPIADPSDDLIRLSADECVYWMKSARDLAALAPQDIEKRKERERQLEQMAAGKIKVDMGPAQKSSGAASAIVPLGGCITRDGTKGMW